MTDTIVPDGQSAESRQPILAVKNLTVTYPVRGGGRKDKRVIQAVNDVSFQLEQGETLAIVGESGCGKSSLGKALLGLIPNTTGTVTIEGSRFDQLHGKALRVFRRKVQMVFQDPDSSLNPRMRVGTMLDDTQRILGADTGHDRRSRSIEMLESVGLGPEHYQRFPAAFSGGQKQRLGIARALIADPTVVICDEPVSALDVSIQAQILNLLQDLQERLQVSYIFISHDLAVVRYISDRVAVMYLGEVVEEGTAEDVFTDPKHPYTRVLISAIPSADPNRHGERIPVEGEVPSPLHPPAGCKFHTRCPFAMPQCSTEVPQRVTDENGHSVACHLFPSAQPQETSAVVAQ